MILFYSTIFQNHILSSDIIRAWVINSQRLPLESIPHDVPVELRILIEACWDQEADKRPNFSGKEIIVLFFLIYI